MTSRGTGDGPLHASAVAVDGRGLLITGRAGAGKTTLAIEMIALGAELIADDRVQAKVDASGALLLSAPTAIAGIIEVRGFGLARLPVRAEAPLTLIADLDQGEAARLPERQHRMVRGIACPVILCKGRQGLAAVLTCLLRAKEWLGTEHFAGEV